MSNFVITVSRRALNGEFCKVFKRPLQADDLLACKLQVLDLIDAKKLPVGVLEISTQKGELLSLHPSAVWFRADIKRLLAWKRLGGSESRGSRQPVGVEAHTLPAKELVQ